MGLGGRDRSAMIEWCRVDGPNGLILLLYLMTFVLEGTQIIQRLIDWKPHISGRGTTGKDSSG